MQKKRIVVLLPLTIMLLASCTTVPKAGTPYVEVKNQIAPGDTFDIEYVVSVGPGWIVIHADLNGKPGESIGHSAVTDGVNKDVKVKIDVSKKTEILIAMLHVDNGEVGTYEFPIGDPPVRAGDMILMKGFSTKGEPMFTPPPMSGGY